MRLDVNTFIGRFPFRLHPGGTVHYLRSAMERAKIDACWVSHLSAMYWRDPTEGNEHLYRTLETEPGLRPVPAVHPELANAEAALDAAAQRGVPAVRSDPTFYGLDPAGARMRRLAAMCGERDLPLMMAVRVEDGRQRHPNDGSSPLEPWAVRALVRSHPRVRLLITHADRDFVEQVHWGATPDEALRLLWDVSWVWGPPEDHLAHLIATIGAERFCLGTGMPLRLPETGVARLDLTPLSPAQRTAIESANAHSWSPLPS